jgi:hypothetical protein
MVCQDKMQKKYFIHHVKVYMIKYFCIYCCFCNWEFQFSNNILYFVVVNIIVYIALGMLCIQLCSFLEVYKNLNTTIWTSYFAFTIQYEIEKNLEGINKERVRYAFMSIYDIRIKCSLLDTKLQAQGGQVNSTVILHCTGQNTCRYLICTVRFGNASNRRYCIKFF